MTDLKQARRLAWEFAQLAAYADYYNLTVRMTEKDREAANTIRDLCDEVGRLKEKLTDKATKEYRELRDELNNAQESNRLLRAITLTISPQGDPIYVGRYADLRAEVERLREEIKDHEDDALERHAAACERD